MIALVYETKAPIYSVWEALIDPDAIERWSGAKAKMSDKEGAKFSLWAGDIYGTNTKIVEPTEIWQDWYSGDWATPSKVIIRLSETDTGTTIELEHTDVPEAEKENIKKGWQEFYFEPLIRLVELAEV